MQCLSTIRLADAVVLLRRRARLSQTALAAASGLTPSAISRLESGRTTPEPDTVQRLAGTLQATADELIWLQALAAHARLMRCAHRERTHWSGTATVLETLGAALVLINDPNPRREAPMQ